MIWKVYDNYGIRKFKDETDDDFNSSRLVKVFNNLPQAKVWVLAERASRCNYPKRIKKYERKMRYIMEQHAEYFI